MNLNMPSTRSLKVGDIREFTLPVVTTETVRDFMSLSGDVNAIHWNEDYCALTFLKEPVAHGVLLLSYLSNILGTKFPGPGTVVLSMTSNFTNAFKYRSNEKGGVHPGDYLVLTVKAVEGTKATLEYVIANRRAPVGSKPYVSGEVVVTNVWDITEKQYERAQAKQAAKENQDSE